MGQVSSFLSERLFKLSPWSMWSWRVGKRDERDPDLVGLSSWCTDRSGPGPVHCTVTEILSTSITLADDTMRTFHPGLALICTIYSHKELACKDESRRHRVRMPEDPARLSSVPSGESGEQPRTVLGRDDSFEWEAMCK
jgi:hypothetical protein